MKTETKAPEVLWLGDHILLGATMWAAEPHNWRYCAIARALRSAGRYTSEIQAQDDAMKTWPWLATVSHKDVPKEWNDGRGSLNGLNYLSSVFFDVCDYGRITLEDMAKTANKWQKKYDPTVKAAKKHASAHARRTKAASKGGKPKASTNGTRNILARVTSK